MTRIIGFYSEKDGKFWFDSIMQDGERQETKYRLGPEHITEKNDIIVQMQNADSDLLAIEIHSKYLTYFDEEGNPIIFLNNATFSVMELTEEEEIRARELFSEDLNADFEDWDPVLLESIRDEIIQELSETCDDVAIDLIDRENSGKHYSSVREFFDDTHDEERMNQLINVLQTKTGDTESRQERAWRNSLPDFAEMISSPVEYLIRTNQRIEEHLESLLEYAENFRERYVMNEMQYKEVFGEELYEKLAENDITEEQWRELCDKQYEAIKNRNDRIEATIEEMRANNISVPEDLVVEIEYQFPGTQRDGRINNDAPRKKSADVILYSRSKNRYMVVELKQWTEDQIMIEDRMIKVQSWLTYRNLYTENHPFLQTAIYMTVLQNPDWNCPLPQIKSFPECKGIDKDNNSCRQCIESAENVRELYPYCEDDWWDGEQWVLSKYNIEEEHRDPLVVPLIYLHNQYIDKGKLDKNCPPHIENLFREKNGRAAIIRPMKTLFSRNHCDEAIKTIIDFFSE